MTSAAQTIATAGAPELIAHRGYAARYPENTLPALQGAAVAGARFVEVDVQLSADAVPVLFHDRSLRRVCGASGAIHRTTYERLMRLSAHEPRRFGTRYQGTPLLALSGLRAFLEAYPDVTAFVEIKSSAVYHFGAEAVLDAVARDLAPVALRCVLIARSVPLLGAARQRLERGGAAAGWAALGGVISRWRQRRSLAHLDLEYLFCAVEGLPSGGTLAFGDARIAVYEVADPALALRLHTRGAHFIETFAIGELRRALFPGALA